MERRMRNKDQRLAFIWDLYSLFSAQWEGNGLGWASIESVWDAETARHVRFVFFAKAEGGKQNKKDFDSVEAQKETRRAASHRSLQSHNSRRAGTHSRPAFTAGSRSLVWLCERVCVCEHKHAEPGGGCEKSVDVEPTGTWRTNAKQRDVKC